MIGVAVVEHARRYLVGERSADKTLPGKAEFPGGKCGPHESPRTAAVRECKEETGLDVRPVRLLMERIFQYDHDTVDLRFWLCEAQGEIPDDLQGFRWVDVEELMTLNFPAANAPLLEKIQLEAPLFGTPID